MNCNQVQVLVRTSPRAMWSRVESQSVQHHLATCAECAMLLENEAAFETQLRSLTEVAPPSDMLAIVMARTASIPRQHAKTPSRQRRLFGSASRSLGVAIALGAYLFSLVFNGAGAQFSVWDHERLVPIMPDAIALVFGAGLLLYVIGLLMRGDEVMR